jgi:hypothetical protein
MFRSSSYFAVLCPGIVSSGEESSGDLLEGILGLIRCLIIFILVIKILWWLIIQGLRMTQGIRMRGMSWITLFELAINHIHDIIIVDI